MRELEKRLRAASHWSATLHADAANEIGRLMAINASLLNVLQRLDEYWKTDDWVTDQDPMACLVREAIQTLSTIPPDEPLERWEIGE